MDYTDEELDAYVDQRIAAWIEWQACVEEFYQKWASATPTLMEDMQERIRLRSVALGHGSTEQKNEK